AAAGPLPCAGRPSHSTAQASDCPPRDAAGRDVMESFESTLFVPDRREAQLMFQLARTAQSLAADATPRERGHIAALTAWSEGELDRAIGLWESILRTHPHDVVAFRLAHFVNFWLGRPQDMVASVERVMPAWSEDIFGYASNLAKAAAF